MKRIELREHCFGQSLRIDSVPIFSDSDVNDSSSDEKKLELYNALGLVLNKLDISELILIANLVVDNNENWLNTDRDEYECGQCRSFNTTEIFELK